MTPDQLEQYDYLAHSLIQLDKAAAGLSQPQLHSRLRRLASMAREIRGPSKFEEMAGDLRFEAFRKRMGM